MSADTLLALAERCEKATGPDRELDMAIHVALFVPDDAARVDASNGYVGYFPASGPYESAQQVLGFSRSVDAAMTLVPEGDGVGYTLSEGPWVGGNVRMWEVDTDGNMLWEVVADAAAPALGFTAATLKARASLIREDVA